MRHFPIFLDLTGQTALVIGEGEIASRKAAELREAGATVRQSPHFAPGLLDRCVIAIGAGAADADLQALYQAAAAKGIPVNVVDRPEFCRYITPAIVERGPITIAISSGGTAPVLARLLRAKIEAAIPPNYAALANFAARIKDRIRARFPDQKARRRALETLLDGPAAAMLLAGRAADAEAALEAALSGNTKPEGIVHLVGAGPGAPDLLTLRAQRLLGEADIIIHDRLVSDAVLRLARRDATLIYAGKQRANHCLKQSEINDLLIAHARQGRKVVRLKGGDPLIFGRGGEEAEALEAAGIPFAIVPGVTAALACAAGAAIPLTHRNLSRSVTFLTGHTKDGHVDADWTMLAKGGTVAVYMGVAALPHLFAAIVKAGNPPGLPAALIENGGTEAQRTLRLPLNELVEAAPLWARSGPALLLLGAVTGVAPRAEA
jgi:uroporphyrin-III C-methyltransferase/precorrin-2 dehydrogenase/sirohydrochlorin ferrochelatase